MEKRLIDINPIIGDLTAMKSMYDAILIDGMIKGLENAPAVDAVEVVHGMWEASLYGKELMCSCCKATFFDEDQVGGSRYCPNCGAKMDLEG